MTMNRIQTPIVAARRGGAPFAARRGGELVATVLLAP